MLIGALVTNPKRGKVTKLPSRHEQPDETQNGFVQLWNDWMDETTHLTHIEFRTAIWIMRYQGHNKWAYPSYATLAEKVGVNRRWMRRIMKSLERKKIVVIDERKGHANRYKIIEKHKREGLQALPERKSTSEHLYTGGLQTPGAYSLSRLRMQTLL